MKKGLLVFVTIVLTAAMLVACGKPSYMSKTTYDYGCRALEVMEKYNHMEVSEDEAKKRLNSIEEVLEEEADELTNNLTYSSYNLLVRSDITDFLIAMQGIYGTTYDEEDSLRELLGK